MHFYNLNCSTWILGIIVITFLITGGHVLPVFPKINFVIRPNSRRKGARSGRYLKISNSLPLHIIVIS